MHLRHLWRRSFTRQLPAARLEDVEAAAMFGARANVGTIDPVVAKELLGHPCKRRRAKNAEIGDAIGTLVPSLKDQPAEVHAVVVMEVREERVRDVCRS